MTLKVNCSYCSGFKVCAAEGCHYTVSTKQRINRCLDHKKTMSLVLSGPCNCHLAYIQYIQLMSYMMGTDGWNHQSS